MASAGLNNSRMKPYPLCQLPAELVAAISGVAMIYSREKVSSSLFWHASMIAQRVRLLDLMLLSVIQDVWCSEEEITHLEFLKFCGMGLASSFHLPLFS